MGIPRVQMNTFHLPVSDIPYVQLNTSSCHVHTYNLRERINCLPRENFRKILNDKLEVLSVVVSDDDDEDYEDSGSSDSSSDDQQEEEEEEQPQNSFIMTMEWDCGNKQDDMMDFDPVG